MLLTTYLTGYVDDTTLCYLGGFPGDGLMELFGLYTEEIDTLYPSDVNGIAFDEGFLEEAGVTKEVTKDAKITDFCEVLKVQEAEILGTYTKDFYKGTPVVTRNHYGKGDAYYVGARLDEAGMKAIYRALFATAEVTCFTVPEGVEYHRRTKDTLNFDFYMNETEEERTVALAADGRNLMNGEAVKGSYNFV